MVHSAIHPDRDQLSHLIDGTLADPEQQRITDHVGDCVTCQQAIQTLASGELAVEQLVKDLESIDPPAQSAYWEAIARFDVDPLAKTTGPESRPGDPKRLAVDPANSGRTSENPLSFLQPSGDPAFIGRLHHFEVSRVIGRGGMGIVLEAFDPHLHRNVAIKVLNPQFQAHEIARQRFCREGRAAAAISHEHVVQMFQVARAHEGEIAYLVMQLIEGETLEQRLARTRQPLPPQEVARLGMQIAAGLSAAHARHMVHRDIKPANVLIEAETDRVKLTDFGLAIASDDVKLTQTGIVTGTPLYMSPEQAMGGTADERSDLFSLGAVMYEMATAASPFSAASPVGVMKRIMDEMPVAPHIVNPAIGKPLSEIIMALLAKRPENRPESSSSVATALAGIVTQYGPISPLQIPAVAAIESKKLSGNHRIVHRGWITGAWLTAAVAALSMIVAVTLWMNPIQTIDRGDAFPSVVLAGNPGTVWSVDFSPDGKQIAAAIEDGSVRIWDVASQTLLKSFNGHRGIAWMVRYHPSRPLVVSSGDDGWVKLWDSSTLELLKEWRADSSVKSVAFSPSGDRLVAGDREGIVHVYGIESGEEITRQQQPGSILGVDYSADGKLIATVGSDKLVRLWDAESLEQRQTMSGHDGPIYNVRFASTGPFLATVGWNKNVRIWNSETGAEVANLVGSEGDVWSVSFCSSGSHLVTGEQNGAARVWDLSTSQPVATLRGHTSSVHNVTLDPNVHRIATSSRDGTIRVWDMSGL